MVTFFRIRFFSAFIICCISSFALRRRSSFLRLNPVRNSLHKHNSGPCNSFNCLGNFKHVCDDDDDDDELAPNTDIYLLLACISMKSSTHHVHTHLRCCCNGV